MANRPYKKWITAEHASAHLISERMGNLMRYRVVDLGGADMGDWRDSPIMAWKSAFFNCGMVVPDEYRSRYASI